MKGRGAAECFLAIDALTVKEKHCAVILSVFARLETHFDFEAFAIFNANVVLCWPLLFMTVTPIVVCQFDGSIEAAWWPASRSSVSIIAASVGLLFVFF